MFSVNRPPDAEQAAALDRVLHEVVETLARIERAPCSPGEREAAQWLAQRLGAVEGGEGALEDEPSWGTVPPTATRLGLLGIAAAALTLGGRRGAAAVVDRPRRTAVHARRGAQPTARLRARGHRDRRARRGARGRCLAQRDGARRQRQPLGRGRPGRAGRDAARASRSGPARVARLLW